jgi:single-stranded DNA-binding protein
MIAALVQGTLAADPVERATSAGKPYWTANVRVPAGGDALFIGLATFEPVAGERLMRLAKGAAVAATGALEQSSWRGKDGEERTGWRLTAHEVLSVHQARKRAEVAHG